MGPIIHFLYYLCTRKIKAIARVAKLVDAPDLGSGVLRRVGSSPITRTIGLKRNSQNREFLFPVLRIDNASSDGSHAAWVQLTPGGSRTASVVNFQPESTMRAAMGHAQHK